MLHMPRLLVLEDEPIIALDIEDTLIRGGFSDITLLRSCHEALQHLQSSRPDAALLDLSLIDGVCRAVAERLRELTVPFVIYSGLEADLDAYGKIFGEGKWLLKPSPPEVLLAAMIQTLNEPKRDEAKVAQI